MSRPLLIISFDISKVLFFESVNLKCDPIFALELRERYEAVIPGFHMNKQHWNTVKIDGSIPDSLISEWIDHSYDLVFRGLSGKVKDNL